MLTRPPPTIVRIDSRKKSRTAACLRLPLSIAIACIYPSAAHSLPQNPDVMSGSVSITTSGRAMQVNQTTNKAIIDWQKFGIGTNESLTFNQPSRASVILNRVTSGESSVLDGALNANGQVFLINPNGVLIGATARINVSGLLASTLDVENRLFLNSEYVFSAKSASEKTSVFNDGTITAVDGGYVVMLSNHVRNNGMIDAPSGHVLMGAGSHAILYTSDQSLLGYRIASGSAAALVENVNRIRADSGQVTLAARGLTGASQLASAAVNNSGIIEARTLSGKHGAIVLSGDMENGRVFLNGTLDASARSGNGGTVDTTAFVVSAGSNAEVSTESLSGKTGIWTITSDHPVIGRNLGNVSNTALSNALDRSNIAVIASGHNGEHSGNLSVDQQVTTQSSNKLVLKAVNNLSINAPVIVGSGGLAAHADTNGTGVGKVMIATGASLRAGAGGPIDIYTNVPDYRDTAGYEGFITSPYRLWMLVNNVRQLQDMDKNLSGNYVLGKDIDAAETATWHGGAGFKPIGLLGRRFDGQLDGMNHVISNLTINRPRNDFVGLFSELAGTVRNLGLQDVHVTANSHAGAFAGYNGGVLNNVYATGSVSVDVEPGNSEQATATAGGLVGSNGRNGVIKDAYSLVKVGGRSVLGGIAGANEGLIDGVYAAGKVGEFDDIYNLFQFGGLVGTNSGQVRNAYWTTDGTGKNLAFGSDSASAGLVNSVSGLTSEGIKKAYLALNYDTAWFRYDGYTAPLLRSFMTPLTINGMSRQIDKVYDGQAFEFVPRFFYSNPEATKSTQLHWINGAISGGQGPDVGTYTSASTTAFWSDQRGYLINNSAIWQDALVTVSARPVLVQASPDTKFFDHSTSSALLPAVSNVQSKENLGLAKGDVLIAGQSFDSLDAGNRTLSISSLEIRNSAGKDITSNYQVSRIEASGKIETPTTEPTIDPKPDVQPGSVPDPVPDPVPGLQPPPTPDLKPEPMPGSKTGPMPDLNPQPGPNLKPPPTPGSKPDAKPGPGTGPDNPGAQNQGSSPGSGFWSGPGLDAKLLADQPAGANQGEIAGPFVHWKAKLDSGDIADDAGNGNLFSTGYGPGEQEHGATLFITLFTGKDDELLKKNARTKKAKNSYRLFIRDGGIHVPEEGLQQK